MKLGQFYLEVKNMLLDLKIQSARSLRILAYNLCNQELISHETFAYLESLTPSCFTRKMPRGLGNGTYVMISGDKEYMMNGSLLAKNLTELLLTDGFIQYDIEKNDEEGLIAYLDDYQTEDWIEKIPLDNIYIIKVNADCFVSVKAEFNRYHVYHCTLEELEDGTFTRSENLLSQGAERFLYTDGENIYWKKDTTGYVKYILNKKSYSPFMGELLGANKHGVFIKDKKGSIICETSDETDGIKILDYCLLGAKHIVLRDCLLVVPKRDAINVFPPYFVDFGGKRKECRYSLKYACFVQQFLYMEEVSFLLDVIKEVERKNLLLSFLNPQPIDDADDVITLTDQLLTAGFTKGMQAVSIIEAMHLFKDKKIDVNLDFLFELVKCQHLCSQNPGTSFMSPSFCATLRFLSKKPFFKQKMKNPARALEGFVFWNAIRCKRAKQMEIEDGFVDFREIDGYKRKMKINKA